MVGCLKESYKLYNHSRRGYKSLFNRLLRDRSSSQHIDVSKLGAFAILASNKIGVKFFLDTFNKNSKEPLYANLEKCTFYTHVVVFLGFVVGSHKVKVDEEKVKLECDASNVGIWAILLHEGHPITYFSEKLKGANLNYSTYDKELYALIRILHEFVIHSDHESLKHLRGQGKLSKRHAKYVKFLEQFPYVIKHKKGKGNVVADALSRRHALLSMLETKLFGLESLKDMYGNDIDIVRPFPCVLIWPMRRDIDHICERCLICRMTK
ncbi:Retrovirus-related Pol polyprotein, partial [Mucuna pruriens]